MMDEVLMLMNRVKIDRLNKKNKFYLFLSCRLIHETSATFINLIKSKCSLINFLSLSLSFPLLLITIILCRSVLNVEAFPLQIVNVFDQYLKAHPSPDLLDLNGFFFHSSLSPHADWLGRTLNWLFHNFPYLFLIWYTYVRARCKYKLRLEQSVDTICLQ